MTKTNLVETLRWRASQQPERTAYTFLMDGEEKELRMTYGQLDHQARSIAASLSLHQAYKEPVLLLYPSGLDYIAAFFGCLYAGAIAVPAYPPAQGRALSRFYSVLADAQPKVVLTTESIRSGAAMLINENPALKAMTWIGADNPETDLAEEWREPAITGESIAFLQYTSGSTSSPRGVIVTHGNLIHNEEMIRIAMARTERSTCIGWLPLYHDMGLIGNVLQSIHIGAPCVLMSPEAFLRKPSRWLKAISRYRAETSGGPNFAYELCLRKVSPEERSTLDLSSWTLAFNGAEPVRHETLERFAEAFAPCGFRREAFYPCYGLAEATLFVTGAQSSEIPRAITVEKAALGRNLAVARPMGEAESQALVSCGQSHRGQEIAIVDPDSRIRLSSGQIGEIWVKGPSVAAGYWKRPEETAVTFEAHLADTGEGPFLRTGDLGFLGDGELFVTGRIKDLIIIRGRNHYPQDIELTVERSCEGLRLGRGVAFSIEIGETAREEGLAFVQEIPPNQGRLADSIIERIRQAISEEHEVQIDAVALVRPGSVLKTSSGKLQRRATREAYLNGRLDKISEWVSNAGGDIEPCPANVPAFPKTLEEIEDWLQSSVAAELKVDRPQVDLTKPLAALGVDSLSAVELTHRLETELGIDLSVSELLQQTNLSDLAAEIFSKFMPAQVPAVIDEAQEALSTRPLSYGQRSLFFLNQLEPNSPAYNLARAARITGELDPGILAQSFRLIIERQAVLRTTFTVDHGEPVQQVHSHMEIPIQQQDTSSWDERRLEEEMIDEANRPFDLRRGPLLRLRLFTSPSRRPVLLMVIHHIISDLWSFAVLIEELKAIYDDLSSGKAPALQPLKLQYPDYTQKQAELIAGPEGERLWNYWRRQMTGYAPVLNLPLDKPRPVAGESKGAVQTLKLDAQLTQALKRLSREENATLYMTLLAVLQTLLYRYTGQEDFLIGSPTAGRARAEFRELIGYFVNPVVIRADLSGEPTFRRLLDRVRRNVLETFEHQDYPFAMLVERLQPDRADRPRGGSPFLQVMFVLQKAPSFADEELAAFALGSGGRIQLGKSLLEAIPLDQQISLFDLTLTVAEVGAGLSISLQYDTGLFDAGAIRRMLTCFNALLGAIADDPNLPVSTLSLPIDAEEERLLKEWADPGAQFHQPLCLHELFEEQVRLRPYQAALSFEGRRLTYDQLNREANRLAWRLRGLGVGPEVPVGLFMDRSFDLAIGILAILKAGGAYVPLDPSYSQERLAFMLADAGVALLLTEQRMRERLPEQSAPVVFVDLDREIVSRQSEENPRASTTPANLAYVIYTSGSTGKPKGTEVTHANVTRLFAATHHWFCFSEGDVWTLFHSYAFDFSVWELWGALLYGGRLVVTPYWVSRSPAAFLELLERESVTVLNQTPSAFRQLIQSCESSEGAGRLKLRLVIFGGEALDVPSLRPWFERYGDQQPQLVNMYGITETTVHVTYRPLTKEDLDKPGGSRIGRPIPDLRLYILDPQMRPVPVGVVGEMYVGGAGVARGYLGRPELTAERFLRDPFTTHESRLYRTGDLARRLPDGDIEYIGRNDEQVKIRGFRIETREIQDALLQHPQIRDAVVIAVGETPGERRLAAYVVPRRPDEAPSIDELRLFVRERLADYMAPSIFVVLEALPLTPHGKLDRRALPVPDGDRPGLTAGFSPPQTEAERLLAEVWSQVLRIERIGIDDNFFDLGGDSIRSIQVKSRAEQQSLSFSLQQMFQNPTIRQLAGMAVSIQPTGESAVTQPLSLVSAKDRDRLSGDLEDAYPLTRLQAGLVFHSERSVDYETYVTSLHLRMPLDLPTLQRSADQLVSRHTILRTSFNLSSYSEPLQLVHRESSVRLRFEDLSHLSGEEQDSVISEFIAGERRRRFDWVQCPLFDLQVHRRSPDTLQFTLSEPFLDGWSVASLLTELFTIYFSLLQGEDVHSLPPLKAGFRDYVALELEALRSPTDREYWLTKMSDYSARRLPQCNAVSSSLSGPAIERLNISIPAAVSDGLYSFAHRARVPVKSVLLAAHMRVLNLLTGDPDVVTGLLYNGRPETTDGDKVLGLFLNALPMRLSLNSGTWTDLARAAFDAEQEAMPHRRYPLAEMQRRRGGRPLFEAAFNFTHFHVYQSLRRIDGIEVLGGYASDQTFFDLTAQFNLDHTSSSALPPITLALDYRAARFGRDQMAAMGGYYGRVLNAMAADPNGAISICLLSHEERNQILFEWNDTAIPYSDTLCLHELIEQQVELTPGHVAVTFEGRPLTYSELNRRANQLAHYLRCLDVGPGVLIGLCLERSLEMAPALLGVLKAGGAYVPLDPTYPEERLAFMIEDAGLKLILTARNLAPVLPVNGTTLIFIDGDGGTITLQPETNPPRQATSDDLAYVIYTSGSTGTPKGVQIRHRALVNFMQSMEREPGLAESDTLLAVTTLSFDIAALEIFLPLITGAGVVIATHATAANGYSLSELLSKSGATVMQATPTTWRLLLEAGWRGQDGFVVLCGGEALPRELANKLIDQGCLVWNMYGPTETTIWSTVCRMDLSDEPVSIGRPIANTRIYLLDHALNLAPVGVPGELYIGGHGLSAGYLNREELTAERFIRDHLSAEPSQRLYRTGDMARYLPDGRIELLGRIDQQIKIRGHRIELGEIEAVMQKHPAVRQAAAVAVENNDGNKRLIAYLVFSPGFSLSIGEIRDFLKARLPKYMIPAAFVALDALPLTPNGKVDRNRLSRRPEPAAAPPEVENVLSMIEGLSIDEVRALLLKKRSEMSSKAPV